MSQPVPVTSGAPPRTLFVLLDIDNTLYNYKDTGFGEEMHDRIFEYVRKTLGFTHAEAAAKSVEYYHDYGLSLHGYVKDYHIDAKEYSDYVHQCSYDRLQYNAPLVAMLRRLQFRDPASPPAAPSPASASASASAAAAASEDAVANGRHHLLYFTNANRPHARQVLIPLGLKDIFTRPRPAGSPVNTHHKTYDQEGFDDAVEWLGFSYEDQWRLTAPRNANKPMQEAYEAIYTAIDNWIASDEAILSMDGSGGGGTTKTPVEAAPSPLETAHRREHLKAENVVMVDDSLMNLVAPLELGWKAVWFAHDSQKLPDALDTAKKGPLMAKALADGRLKVIYELLELEAALNELAQ